MRASVAKKCATDSRAFMRALSYCLPNEDAAPVSRLYDHCLFQQRLLLGHFLELLREEPGSKSMLQRDSRDVRSCLAPGSYLCHLENVSVRDATALTLIQAGRRIAGMNR